MSRERISTLLTIILLLITALNIMFTVGTHIRLYMPHDVNVQYSALKKAYITSQYVDKHPKRWISDVEVNTYAGMSYVKGVNPILIAPDTPPLGRYLIGVSAMLFHNENILTLIAGIGAVTMLFIIGMKLFASPVLASITPAFYTSEKIFKDQLIATPLLDIFQLFFLLITFYSFTNGLLNKNDKKWFILTGFGLGLFISTKFYVTGLTVAASCLIVLFLHKKVKKITSLLLAFIISLVVLLCTYLKSFVANPNPIKFLGIQKYVFLYHKSQLILPLSIWPLLLFNRWHVWFGNSPVIHDSLWFISWPIVTCISLVTIFLYVLKKLEKNSIVEVYMLWIVLYLLFFSFGQITSRYLVILLPVMYLVSIFGLSRIIGKFYEHRH